MTIDTLNLWSDRWSALMLTAVVQSTLLVIVIALVARLLRRSSPAVRYWLWQIVAIKLLVVPLWTWNVGIPWLVAPPVASVPAAERPLAAPTTIVINDAQPQPHRTAIPSDPAAHDASAPRVSKLSWTSGLFLAWAAIVAFQLARLLVQRRRLSQALAQTVPADDTLTTNVDQVAALLGLARAPVVRLTQAECSPFVCGIASPTLVLPRSLLETLDAPELRQVLAHELAHVKRRDLVWGWIPELARIAYFFHPVAYWTSYRVRLERELACDQLALAHGGRGPAAYADTLVRVVSAASQPSIFRTSATAGLDGAAGVAESDATAPPQERTPDA